MPYVGQSLKRFEDHRLLTGQGQFLDDLTFQVCRMPWCCAVPMPCTVLTSLEVTAARQAPGVVAVVTAADLEHVAAHINPAMSTPMHSDPPNTRCWPGTRSAMWGSPSPS